MSPTYRITTPHQVWPRMVTIDWQEPTPVEAFRDRLRSRWVEQVILFGMTFLTQGCLGWGSHLFVRDFPIPPLTFFYRHRASQGKRQSVRCVDSDHPLSPNQPGSQTFPQHAVLTRQGSSTHWQRPARTVSHTSCDRAPCESPDRAGAPNTGVGMRPFSRGDLVRLVSGGPVMAVGRTERGARHQGQWQVLCFWFDDQKHSHWRWFPARLLTAEGPTGQLPDTPPEPPVDTPWLLPEGMR